MPLVDALALLHRTARVYLDATTLIDPTTGQTFPTLMPRRHPMAVETVTTQPVLLLNAA
jgi:hypothetical protein